MENKCWRCLQTSAAAVFEYDTVKLVHIRNQKIGFVYRLVQLAIIGYILGYVIIYKKGYQETDLVVSSVTTKMKGTALATNDELWDVADYVVPPEENNAVFVTTSAIITANQTRGVCPEAAGLAKCTSDEDCPAGEYVTYGNGIRTGQCDNQTRSCYIRAWCPVEDDKPPTVPLLGNATKNFTLLIKNSIRYKKFNFFKRNILQGTSSSYLEHCKFNKDDPVDQFCPIFVLSQMLKDAGADWEEIALNGGIIGIFINWDCNLDRGSSECKPDYSFMRMDKPDSSLSKGYNFRYPVYSTENGTLYRELVKAYGIRFEILVSGKAGRFSIVPLMLNIGSGIALLGIATVICDFLVLYIVKRRNYYKKNKYQMVKDRETLLHLDTEHSHEDSDEDSDDGNDEAQASDPEKEPLNRSAGDAKLYTE